MKQILTVVFIQLLAGCMTSNADDSPGEGPAGKRDIVNGDFSMGDYNWSLWTDESADASFEIEDSELKLLITKPGKRRWSITLSSPGVIIEKGRSYTVNFSARSDTETRIYASIAMNREPYYGYSGAFHFYPDPVMREYSFSFIMRQETDARGSFQFSLGNYGTRSIWVDNISIVDNGPGVVPDIPEEFPVPANAALGRGVQFGLEMASPLEGSHVPQLTEEYFDAVEKDGRFTHIRLPVWWEYHTAKSPPYTIDPSFLRRVDWAVSQSLHRGYPTILNMHWFRAMEKEPKKNFKEYLAVWRQITGYFKDYPAHLYFEILNEPNGTLDKYWSKFAVETYDLIRGISPSRPIIISGPYWAHMTHLTELELPQRIKDDPNVLIQFHPYVPSDFCFQGSPGNGAEDLEGIRWRGTPEEKKHITRLFDSIEAWAAENNLRLYNGEFTAMSSGNSLLEDRLRWIGFIIGECEKRGIPWNYYDFSGEECFVYDTAAGEWNEEVMGVLFPDK